MQDVGLALGALIVVASDSAAVLVRIATVWLYRHSSIPAHLKAPVRLVSLVSLVSLVCLVIIITVLAHDLRLRLLTQRLWLTAKMENGLLIVGASSVSLAQALRQLKIDVIVADGSYNRLKPLRMDGINVFYGEILSEHAHDTLDVQNLSHLLCATDNDDSNALACKAQSAKRKAQGARRKAQGKEFSHQNIFQLPSSMDAGGNNKNRPLQQRGYTAFSAMATFKQLHQWLDSGRKQ